MGLRIPRFSEVVLFLFLYCSFALGQSPEIDAIAREIQHQSPAKIRELIVKRLGPPARDIGSGFQIEQWDVDGGVLTFHQAMGPNFTKDNKTTRLLITNNLAGIYVKGSYQMTSLGHAPIGVHYYLGDLKISANEYRFVDENKEFLKEHQAQRNTFFFQHPHGKAMVKWKTGFSAVTRLEDVPDGTTIAIVTLSTFDSNAKKEFRIVSNQSTMSLSIVAPGMGCSLSQGWLNYWN